MLVNQVSDNLMVDLVAGSAKLRARAERLVVQLADVPAEEARELLDRADGEVKTAVVMGRLDLPGEEARNRIREAGGFLRGALGEELP